MIVTGRETVEEFLCEHGDCRKAVASMLAEFKAASWTNPHDVKAHYPKASIIGDGDVVLNLRGSKYRVWIRINYPNKVIMIRKMGTHREYDNWEIKQ